MRKVVRGWKRQRERESMRERQRERMRERDRERENERERDREREKKIGRGRETVQFDHCLRRENFWKIFLLDFSSNRSCLRYESNFF